MTASPSPAGLASIFGQERAVARLRSALGGGRVHHAYLFEGGSGVGKRTTALALAQAWNCDEQPGEGCGRCGPCQKIAGGVHPDVVLFGVFNEEGKVKDQALRVRELIASVGFPPHEGRARVVIVDPADELNQTASNILLKTLEEPPPGTHFVLITTMASRLLTTIRSRCQRVAFAPLPDGILVERLLAAGIDGALAEAVAGLSGGSLSRALELASSDELPRRRERVARLLSAARAGRAAQVMDVAAELSGEREEAVATLELLWATYHEALVEAAGGRGAADRGGPGAQLAGRAPVPQLALAIGAVEEATDAVRGFVSPQLAVERMLLRIHQGGGA